MYRTFNDPLASISDADIERIHLERPLESSTPVTVQLSHELFLYDRYDWDGFNPSYAVIRLTRGYFAIVDKQDFRRISKHKWYANVQKDAEGRITKVYAVRTKKIDGRKRFIYLHRSVINAGARVIVDHKHGLTLDCRKGSLKATNNNGNASNGRSPGRIEHHSLKRGVEFRCNGTRYGAQIKIKGETKRSKETWPLTAEGHDAAHRWYLREHKKAFSHRGLPELGAKAKYPVFPPLQQPTSALPDFVPLPTSIVAYDLLATF